MLLSWFIRLSNCHAQPDLSPWQHTCTVYTPITGQLHCLQVSPVTQCSLSALPSGRADFEKSEGSGLGSCSATSLLPALGLWTTHGGPEDDKVPSRVCCRHLVEAGLHHYSTWPVPPHLCAIPFLSDWACWRS